MEYPDNFENSQPQPNHIRIHSLTAKFGQLVNRFVKPKPIIVRFPMFQLPDDSQINLQVSGSDDVGNAVPLPTGTTVVWASSDSTIVSVTPNSSDQTQATVSSVGGVGTTKLGSAQVNATVTIPGQANPITGQFPIEVVASGLATIQFTPGTPSPRQTS